LNCGHLCAATAIAFFTLGAGAAQETLPDRDPTKASAKSAARLYDLASQWTTQDGASVRLGSFAGRPLIAAVGSTICGDNPAIVADIIWVDKHLPAREAKLVRFALFSFDPEADTPERLRLYAESHDLDLNRWTLLRSDEHAASELAAALDVPFRRDDLHAAVISLIDDRGGIVFQQRGRQVSSEAFLERLMRLFSGTN
jgi:protein SCO1/2